MGCATLPSHLLMDIHLWCWPPLLPHKASHTWQSQSSLFLCLWNPFSLPAPSADHFGVRLDLLFSTLVLPPVLLALNPLLTSKCPSLCLLHSPSPAPTTAAPAPPLHSRP